MKERKFKIGDWVCYDHGEYPQHFSKEVGVITHLDYTYSEKFGYSIGGGWRDECLRFAHPDEIAYKESGLPFIYNKSNRKTETIEIINRRHFKIGSLFNTEDLIFSEPKTIITMLMETGMLNNEGIKTFSKIFEKLD